MSMSSVLSTITPIATSVIAGCALVLTFRSSQDNRDKLRLDLFNRRFSIYQRVLVFYQQILVWQNRDEQKALIQPFIEASREALFVFPRASEVYEYLQVFWEHAARIVNHKEMMSALGGAELYADEEIQKHRRKILNEHLASTQWLPSSIDKLETLMKKSMSFERL